jgi:NitT/TauT family transport system ATP-binding protein
MNAADPMSVLSASPDLYRLQSPEVAARFARIREREVILDVRGLGKVYETANGSTEALRGIDLKVHRRELVCVIGPSGCGKSTLIRILAGLEQGTSGQVLLDGKPVQGAGHDRGMVFQGYSLFPWLTVKGNVMFGPLMNGSSRGTAEQHAREWLDLVGLARFADAYPHELSGGMRQRVAIARALVNEPRILLMDEPFGALDAQTRSKMQSHLLDIWRNVDVTVLFITHDLDEAILLADRILVLKPHPGEVQEVIEVPVPRPRSPAQFASVEFQATRARLDALIHPAQPQSPDEAALLDKPMIRFTNVADNIE